MALTPGHFTEKQRTPTQTEAVKFWTQPNLGTAWFEVARQLSAAKGLDLAERRLEEQAAAEGVSVARYRSKLQHRYKEIAAALKQQNEGVVNE